MHEIIIPLSFVPVIAARWFGVLPVFLITSVLAAGMDLLFVILQRYNRPRVEAIMARLAARERRRS